MTNAPVCTDCRGVGEMIGFSRRGGSGQGCKNLWCWPSTVESARWFAGGLVIAIAMVVLLAVG